MADLGPDDPSTPQAPSGPSAAGGAARPVNPSPGAPFGGSGTAGYRDVTGAPAMPIGASSDLPEDIRAFGATLAQPYDETLATPADATSRNAPFGAIDRSADPTLSRVTPYFGQGQTSAPQPTISVTLGRRGLLPVGVTRRGNSYSGGSAPPFGGTPSDGVPDSIRMNAPFQAESARMDANQQAQAAQLATQRRAGTLDARLAENRYQAGLAAQNARTTMDIANSNLTQGGVGSGLPGAQRMAARNAYFGNQDAQARLAAANAAYAKGAQTDYFGNVTKGQDIMNTAAQAPITRAQGVQRLAVGAQQLQSGQFGLQQQQRMQGAVDALHNAKTPDEVEQARQNLLVMQGKNPADWDVKTVGGRVVVGPDGSSTVVGGYGVAINRLTGKSFLIPPPAQAELNNKGTPPPPDAVDHLRANPSLRVAFDMKYGAGSAARVLGQ